MPKVLSLKVTKTRIKLLSGRADNGIRTCDLFITNELLYQLSYVG